MLSHKQFLRDFPTTAGTFVHSPVLHMRWEWHFLEPHHGMGQAWPPSPSGNTSQGKTSTNLKEQDKEAHSLLKKKKKKKKSYCPTKETWIKKRQKEDIYLLKINDSDINFRDWHHMAGKHLKEKKKINPPEIESPFGRNLSKGVIPGGVLTFLVKADAWLLTCGTNTWIFLSSVACVTLEVLGLLLFQDYKKASLFGSLPIYCSFKQRLDSMQTTC